MNFKVRFKNKTFLLTFVVTLLAFIYNTLGTFGIVPAIAQEEIYNIILGIVNLLALLGIVIDPTTEGIKDSENTLKSDKTT